MSGDYKNQLQQHAQRAGMLLPSYQTYCEGLSHAVQFRSSVTVGGTVFNSPLTFSTRKEAERYIAKYALEQILANIIDEGIHLIQNDTVFCKSILNEYAVKMDMQLPTNEISQLEGFPQRFVSSVNFDGKIYNGRVGKNKKEAQQLAASNVIECILGSDTKSVMSRIIRSKSKLLGTMQEDSGANSQQVVGMHIVAPNNPNMNPVTLDDGEELLTLAIVHPKAIPLELPSDVVVKQGIPLKEKEIIGYVCTHCGHSENGGIDGASHNAAAPHSSHTDVHGTRKKRKKSKGHSLPNKPCFSQQLLSGLPVASKIPESPATSRCFPLRIGESSA